MIGQTVGKYRIEARLGRGGMGTVYKALDETLERDVAIKVLNPDIAEPDVLKRFRAEAITLARLNHPNIATVYELARHDDDLLLIIEFVRGETLDRVSERLGPLPVERAVYLIGQVLDALGYAHRAGIVHRDLKPANLMLTDSGIVKVMDFGIARVAGTERLTSSGYIMGTPAYMAPEQVLGEDVDGRADLYAVGVVLYRLLTGKLPFKADTAIAMVQKQIREQPTPVKQLRAELPEWCEEIMCRALAKAPADRFQTADEFRAALTRQTVTMPALELTGVAPAASEMDITVAPHALATPVRQAATDPLAAQADPPANVTATRDSGPQPSPTGSTRKEVTVTLRTSHLAAAGTTAALIVVAAAGASLWRASRAAVPAETSAVRTSNPVSVPTETAPAPEASAAAAATPLPAAVASSAPGSDARQTSATRAADAPGGTTGTTPPLTNASLRDTIRTPRPPDAAANAPTAHDTSRTAPAAAAETEPTLPAFPTVAFSGLKLLTFEGGNTREQDSSLRLGATQLDILTSKGEIAVAVPYQGILAIYHSHSREPRWQGPSGDALPIGKMDSGRFAFFRGTPDWITVRTRQQFIPLRSPGATLQRVIVVLEQRVGQSVIRVGR